MAEWGFYGRKEELDRLQEMLELRPDLKRPRRFGAYCVMGRRGVGKTQLLKESVRRSKPEFPVVEFEFQRGENSATCLERLVDAIVQQGHGALLDSLEPRRPTEQDNTRFRAVAAHLIGKGAVVSLDEFHHADKHEFFGGLVSEIKQMIDGFAGVGGAHPPGKLLLMGSHQQRMANLFACDQPLHQRMKGGLKLRQWSVRDVTGMAAEQGFLSRPGRFLTLWTAYGGVPRYWERFATDHARTDEFHAEADDEGWRRKFIETERRRLDDNAERFDAYVYASLERDLQLVLLMIARNPRGGMTANDVAMQFRREKDRLGATAEAVDPADDLVAEAVREEAESGPVTAGMVESELVKLRRRLDLVVGSSEYLDVRTPAKWRIHDLNSLFQLQMFPELFARGKGQDDEDVSEPRSDVHLRRLHDLEGRTFERFCAEWLRDLPDVERRNSRHGVRRGNLADVDVLAETGEGGNARLLLGGCKRNPGRHDPVALRRQLDAFAGSLAGVKGYHRGDAGRQLGLPRRYAAFSPEFDESSASRLEAEGFECFDIRAMAGELGIDPGDLAVSARKPEQPG